MAHVQFGLVVLAQPAVAHRFQILGQPVVPGADLHILGVAHHRDILLGADGESLCHGGIVLHTVAVLGDELHTGGQGLEVVDAHAVEVLGDGDGLVHIAQPRLGSLLLHHRGLCGRGADGFGVGHQVHEGVPAGRSGAAAGLDILFVFKARGPPVAVQIHKGGQHRQPSGVQYSLPFSGQRRKLLPDGSDLSVPDIDFHRAALCVHSIDEQHDSLPPCS